jgi:hypothetical protein
VESAVLGPAQVGELQPLEESLVEASQPFVGQWSRLVSTTNWEKGRIITAWREALVAQGLCVTEYSDEAWSRLVGGVSGQHVGRLRRVFQRFGAARETYPALYWSHFQAALDWNDADMWLEGAARSGWSVVQMRDQRWTTLGKLEADRPRPDGVMEAELDEDAEPARSRDASRAITGEYSEISGPAYDGPDFGDEPSRSNRSGDDNADWLDGAPSVPPVELTRPFESLPDLPDDLAEAFDAMKLAILRHKRDAWRQIAETDMLRTLDALKALVTAPSDQES